MSKRKKNDPIDTDPNGMLDAVAKVYPPLPGSQKRGPNVGVYGAAPRNRGYGRTGSPSAKGYGSAPMGPKPPSIDLADQDKARTVGLNRGNIVDDTMGGLTFEDMLALLGGVPGSTTDGGGGRGSGGGGYGVARNPDPLGWNAIAQVQALEGGYKNMLDALRQQQQAQLGSFDRATSAVNAGSEAARARQAQIVADLARMSGEAAGRVGDVYSGAGRTIQDLMGQYAQLSAEQNQAAGRTLQAFGANPQMAVPGGSSTSDFLAASGANVARGGAALQAQLAGRGDVYGALGQDFAQRSEAWTQQQLAQLLAERQQAEAAAAREQAQLALDLELKKLALQQQEQARAAQYA